MAQWLELAPGNASTSHWAGRQSKKILEDERCVIARSLGVSRHQLVFVSGATEANSLVVSSVAHHLRQRTSSPASIQNKAHQIRMVILAGEHSSHHRSVHYCAQRGSRSATIPVTTVPLSKSGAVDPQVLAEYLDEDVGYVGCTHVHHETGVRQPLIDIARVIRTHAPHAHWHVDGAQGWGKQPPNELPIEQIDSMSLSAHKMGGFPGIGALYIKDRTQLLPLHRGGSQEGGVRAGTENILGVISMARRCQEIAESPRWLDGARGLYRELTGTLRACPEVVIHGDEDVSAGLAVCLSIKGRSAPYLQSVFERAAMAIGYGSACRRNKDQPLEVLQSMGVDPSLSAHALRISLGPQNTPEEIEDLIAVIKEKILSTPPR